MIRFTSLCIVIFSLSITAFTSAADSISSSVIVHTRNYLETDYLDTTQGFVEDLLGAQITRISDENQLRIIEIDIPTDPINVDRIDVVAESGESISQLQSAEILRDYENNSVSIKLYLPQQSHEPFKLKLIENKESR